MPVHLAIRVSARPGSRPRLAIGRAGPEHPPLFPAAPTDVDASLLYIKVAACVMP